MLLIESFLHIIALLFIFENLFSLRQLLTQQLYAILQVLNLQAYVLQFLPEIVSGCLQLLMLLELLGVGLLNCLQLRLQDIVLTVLLAQDHFVVLGYLCLYALEFFGALFVYFILLLLLQRQLL